MNTFRTSLTRTAPFAAVVALSLTAAACGSDDSTSDQLPESPSTEQPASTDQAPAEPTADGTVIGTANMNGVVVDPQPHAIDEFAIAESYPEQIQITFTGADPNCTAADARAVADGDAVRIELVVGITEDALAKSCMAGEFEHAMSIALTEGLDGRTVTI